MQLTPEDIQAIRLSLQVGIVATACSLVPGFAVAWVLAFREFRGKALLEVLVSLPLTLPPVVIGFLLLLLLGRNGWAAPLLNTLGIQLIFTWKAAVIASATVGFPLLVRSIRLGMESIDPSLIQAAQTLGAPWHDRLLTVVLPLSMRGILAGSSLMFARSLGEFGATIIVAGNIPGLTQTIPLAIYDYAASPASTSMALSLCLVSVAISVVVLFLHENLASRLAGRRQR
ncbi:molybdate ABC transporter permease subunit [Chlorobium sp. N1]|uniref:molybdate ABC transporter permease subunit n=1 Tax=Chlorobium sp. N1 TaxID=2491138 RepID=UPI001040DDF1|nr:molybdate ABC transporter permease subunit [Chlorobium sp. N1]TCD48833.1 molybdate ABC transporter permease subunit [Chlorobium sp. N1]